MSALEQIRKRPALVISVLGVALLLFIITLAWDNKGGNPFSNPNKMVKVDGVEMEYTEFRDLLDNTDNSRDMATQQTYAMRQLISQKMLEKAINKLGIEVTDDEISNILFNPEVNPMAANYQEQYNMIFNPSKVANLTPEQQQYLKENSDKFKEEWNKSLEAMRQQRKAAKFKYLIDGALTANKLDVKDIIQDRNSIANIEMASVQSSTLSDDDFEVSDAEIREAYNKEKGRWILHEETRPVAFARLALEPSETDRAAADKLIASTVEALKECEGIEAISDNYAFTGNNVSAPYDRLPKPVQDAIEALDTATVVVLNNAPRNHYNIAKLLGKDARVDSVKADFVFYNSTKVSADSVLKLLAADTEIVPSEDIFTADSIEIQLADPSAARISFIADATPNEYVTASKEEGENLRNTLDSRIPAEYDVIYRLLSRKAPVTIYDVAVIDYTLVPSTETIDNITTRLRDYANANNTAEAFKKNAADADIPVMDGRVTATTFAIDGGYFGLIPDSSKAARWALEADKGKVSDVFSITDSNYGDKQEYVMVVALSDIFDGDYVPASAEQVKEYYTPRIKSEKKAEKLMGDLKVKGKDVAAYAKAMNTQLNTMAVSLTRGNGGLTGRVAAAKKGELVGPFTTTDGVYVFIVKDVNVAPEADYDTQKDAVKQQMFSRMRPEVIVLGNKRVKGNVAKFLSND